MKSINRLLILITIVLLSMNHDAIGQEVTTIVTLHVNTADIKNPTPENYCYLTAVKGSDTINSGTGKDSIKDFLIIVSRKDSVIWKGVSSNAPYTDNVDIKQIIRTGGPRIFPNDILTGDRTVKGKIKNRARRNKDFDYKIQIKVTTKSGSGVFMIDPRIQVN